VHDSDAILLARAAKIVCNQMFGKAEPFFGFPACCQKRICSPLLLALVNMILEGPNIKDQYENANPAAISIAQSTALSIDICKISLNLYL